MLIRHFTRSVAFQLIEQCGYIDLEQCNVQRGWDQLNRKDRRKISNSIGRFVWFTQAEQTHTASHCELALIFDSANIGAVKWSEYRKRFKNSRSRWQVVQALEISARNMGDDPDDFWVSTKPVALTFMLQLADVA